MDEREPVVVIGRGHSGTRAIAQMLQNSGIFIGEPLNPSFDYLGGGGMYHAARRVGRLARFLGTDVDGVPRWSFRRIMEADYADDTDWCDHIASYLDGLRRNDGPWGWKLPETTLSYPWLARAMPDAYYIHWVRDPRDTIVKTHGTDNIRHWAVQAGREEHPLVERAKSWVYQHELVEQTPKPRRFLRVRLEDYVDDPDGQIGRVSEFLDHEVTPLPPRPDVVGRHIRAGLPRLPQIERVVRPYLGEFGATFRT